MKRISLLITALAGTFLMNSSTLAQQDTAAMADTIYMGGPIVTMVSDGDVAEAIAIADGKIIAVGSKINIMTTKGESTKMVNLQGHTLLPGFIDAHSHVVQQALKFSVVNLDPHPIGDVKTIADVQRKLRQRIEEKKFEPGKWVFGWGYDDTGLKEMRHPNRDDLDAVSKDHPILLMHISNHLVTANTKALEFFGITADTPDTEGGKIQRRKGSKEPNGVLEETAILAVLAKLPMPSLDSAAEMLAYGIKKYAEAGITTAQDGATTKGMLNLLKKVDKQGDLPIDIVAYPLYSIVDDKIVSEIASAKKQFGRFRMGGIKIAVDGSIQGYTAYLSKPYYVQPKGNEEIEPDVCTSDAGFQMLVGTDQTSHEEHSGEEKPQVDKGYRGYASMTLDQVVKYLQIADSAGIQLLAHNNGDGAIDILIEAIKKVRGGHPRPDLRTVIIHAQTIREEQLDFAAKHGLVPSFFPIHVLFWGDRHLDIFLGPELAARIDPARSALKRGMKFTLHHDAPVAGIDILNVVSSAVNRRTTSGKLLGPEQAITPYDAFVAVTKDAAWQYFEEDRKGTLQVGKLADFVVLSDNPFTIDPLKISSIQVVETIKEGATVFAQQQ